MSMTFSSKFQIQADKYNFPYHYIPHFIGPYRLSLTRKLVWGFEYLCYQLHLREMICSLKPNSVLEVGCGDGFFLGSLPAEVEVKVGVDLSERAIAFATAFNPHCKFMACDVDLISEKFDVVAAIEVLEHIPDELVSGFIRSLNNRVNDHGRLMISVPTTVIPLNKKHYRHYNLELLAEQIRRSGIAMDIVEIFYVFKKPWWNNVFSILFDNRLFSLEIKPLMEFAWKQVWNKYRLTGESDGTHLVVLLSNTATH